jgi:hypothetical protein
VAVVTHNCGGRHTLLWRSFYFVVSPVLSFDAAGIEAVISRRRSICLVGFWLKKTKANLKKEKYGIFVTPKTIPIF